MVKFTCMVWAASMVAVQIAPPVAAHHSVAMFDTQKEVTLSGTVREFQFTNPHCFIQLLVASDNITTEWSIELSSPAHLIRSGWKPTTIRVGDRITVVIHPLRAGTNGGLFVSAVRADGRTIGVQQ